MNQMSEMRAQLESICSRCRCKIIRDVSNRKYCTPCSKISRIEKEMEYRKANRISRQKYYKNWYIVKKGKKRLGVCYEYQIYVEDELKCKFTTRKRINKSKFIIERIIIK